MLYQPFVRFRFVKNRKNVNIGFRDIIINAEVVDAKPILGLSKATEPLNPGFAALARFAA